MAHDNPARNAPVPLNQGPALLFVDFDGVLNHARTAARQSFPNGKMYVGLDPRNVARLNAICDAVPDVRLVVSSSWRESFGLEDLRRLLGNSGFMFAERVIGTTPSWIVRAGNVVGGYECRGHEIQAWLDAQQKPPAVIAIVDDGEDMAHLEPRRVRTDMDAGGLGPDHALRIVELLLERSQEAAA